MNNTRDLLRTMDFPQYSFDSPYQDFQQELVPYHDQPIFGDFEITNGNMDDMEFNNADGTLAQSMPPWGHHNSMHRFLKDTQRPPLFNPPPQSQAPSLRQPVTPIPPPAASHYLHESPSLSHEQSSCSSSARSPRADTELYAENMPVTPPDMTLFQSTSFEPFDIHTPHCFSGMGNFSEESHSCVRLADINPAEDIPNNWRESPRMVDFESPRPRPPPPPPQRSYTVDIRASSPLDKDSITSHPTISRGYGTPATPEVITVAEDGQSSFIDNIKGPYPTPSIGDSEDSDAEIDVATSIAECDNEEYDNDDGDDEYKPSKKRTVSSSTRRMGKNKRNAPGRALEKDSPKRHKTSPLVSQQPAKPLPPPYSGNRGAFTCDDCSMTFKDDPSLQTHIKKQHTRPFICVFRFAGCDSTFASKNEWKRHVMSQHLVLTYWLCDRDVCAHNKNSPSCPSSKPSNGRGGRGGNKRNATDQMISLLEPIGPTLPNGAIFNRKDLYTQHLRRMHTPPNIRKPAKSSSSPSSSSKKSFPESSSTTQTTSDDEDWEEQIKTLQSGALRERCKLPTYMHCPANHCDISFTGTDAWDQRMEHVARHLEKAAKGQEEPVVFGGPTDPSLMEWVANKEVAVVREVPMVDGSGGAASTWVLNNPLRTASEGRGVGRKRVSNPRLVSTTTTSSSSSASSVAGGTSRAISLSFPVNTPTVAESVMSEIVVEDSEEDAEGEEE